MKTSGLLDLTIACGVLSLCLASAYGASAYERLQPLQEGDVHYMSGGVGQDEIQAMRNAAKPYNLKMEFNAANGEYMAVVKVILRDGKGNIVLKTASDGPCLFVAVPSGMYKVDAEALDKTVIKSATITDKHGANLQFFWALPKDMIEPDTQERAEEHASAGAHGCF